MGSHHKRNEGLKPVRRTASKPKPEKKAPKEAKDERALALLDIQQAFLDCLASHFSPILDDKKYDDKLQAIKGHFFRRDYAKVFGDKHSCEVYSVRYLPSRALAYANLFSQESILNLLYPAPPPRRPSEKYILKSGGAKKKKVVAVGAGVGSELCALHLLNRLQHSLVDPEDEDLRAVYDQITDIDIIDSADYSDFLHNLNHHLHKTFLPANDESMGDASSGRFSFTYHRQDVLSWSAHVDFHQLLSETTLLTFMFVFNELFAASKLKTMHLIAAISRHLPIGSHVLLIESAGDLSKVKLSNTELKDLHNDEQGGLMVYKFWDHLPGFEKVVSLDRQWYRLSPELQYPLDLENVGYFVRLYRRTS